MCFNIFTDSHGVKKGIQVGTPKLGFRIITCVIGQDFLIPCRLDVVHCCPSEVSFVGKSSVI